MKKKLAITAIIILIILLVPLIIYFFFPEVLFNLAINSERRAALLTKKSIEVDNHFITYLEGGKGETILLVHGFGGNKDNWTSFAKFLTPSYHVVAIDLPGFGESSKIDSESYTIGAQAERLNKFADALGLDKFHIAGNSMGGGISGRYAIEYPDRLLSLALIASGGIQSAEKSELTKLMEKGENPLLVDSAEDFEEMLEFVSFTPPSIPKSILDYMAKEAMLSRDFNEKILKQFLEEHYSLEPHLDKIKTKTLILWGDSDRLIHVSSVKVFQQGLPDSVAVIMKDCGHIPMIERPEEAADHYLKFLKSL